MDHSHNTLPIVRITNLSGVESDLYMQDARHGIMYQKRLLCTLGYCSCTFVCRYHSLQAPGKFRGVIRVHKN